MEQLLERKLNRREVYASESGMNGSLKTDLMTHGVTVSNSS